MQRARDEHRLGRPSVESGSHRHGKLKSPIRIADFQTPRTWTSTGQQAVNALFSTAFLLLSLGSPNKMAAQGVPGSNNLSRGSLPVSRVNTGVATIHLTATIVRVAMFAHPPSPRDDRSQGAIINLTSQQDQMDVTSQWNLIPSLGCACLKTTTVVSR